MANDTRAKAMAVRRFAEDVGLDLDGLVALLENHDLTILSTDRYKQLETDVRDAVTFHDRITAAYRVGGRVPEKAIDGMIALKAKLGMGPLRQGGEV